VQTVTKYNLFNPLTEGGLITNCLPQTIINNKHGVTYITGGTGGDGRLWPQVNAELRSAFG